MGCDEVKEDKNNYPKRYMDIINKNLNTNGNHSNNTDIIIKGKKMDELENIKNEKNIGKSIETLHILKDIFSFLSKKKKLEIIVYNKELQKKLDIKIEDYKKIRGIYRIGERNGKGKEYNKYDDLIFEGEYLNGKRNGKGREYYDENGYLKFEGEYLNGKRNGKGKEYNDNGKLLFEGEYLNGERNGKVREYYWKGKGKFLFEGEYLNGKRWNGKGYNIDGKIEFEIKEGKGKGKEYFEDGNLIFEGEYLNGKWNGKGKEYNEDGKLNYDGEFLNGKKIKKNNLIFE